MYIYCLGKRVSDPHSLLCPNISLKSQKKEHVCHPAVRSAYWISCCNTYIFNKSAAFSSWNTGNELLLILFWLSTKIKKRKYFYLWFSCYLWSHTDRSYYSQFLLLLFFSVADPDPGPMLFWPLPPDLGSLISFFSGFFYLGSRIQPISWAIPSVSLVNRLICFLYLFKKLIYFQFCEIYGYKKGTLWQLFFPLLVFAVVGSGIHDRRSVTVKSGSGTNIPDSLHCFFTMRFRTECEEKLLQMREEVDPFLWAM